MALQTINVCDELKPGNIVLSALPIFHVFDLALCVHTCLISGMTAILVPKLNTKKFFSKNAGTLYTASKNAKNIGNCKNENKHPDNGLISYFL